MLLLLLSLLSLLSLSLSLLLLVLLLLLLLLLLLSVPARSGGYTELLGLRSVTLPFNTSEEVDEYVSQRGYGVSEDVPALWAAIVFSSSPLETGAAAGDWDYTLRFNVSVVPDTTDTVNVLQRETNPVYQESYWQNFNEDLDGPPMASFVPLQLAIDKFILNRTTTADNEAVQKARDGLSSVVFCNDPSIGGHLVTATKSYEYAPQFLETAPFPQTAFSHNKFYTIAKNVFTMFFVLSFLFPASRLIRGLVLEKETKVCRLCCCLFTFAHTHSECRCRCCWNRSVRACV